MDAYELLATHSHNTTEPQNRQSISREHALEVLRDSEQVDLEAGDATHALSRLIDRGYLYEVTGELRITEPEN